MQQWEQALKGIAAHRDALLQDRQRGFRLENEHGVDVLLDRISAVDASVLQHQEILTYMRSILTARFPGKMFKVLLGHADAAKYPPNQ